MMMQPPQKKIKTVTEAVNQFTQAEVWDIVAHIKQMACPSTHRTHSRNWQALYHIELWKAVV